MKTNLKSFIYLLLMACLSLALGGCGRGGADNKTAALVRLAAESNSELTITMVRNEASSVFDTYEKSEVEDLIFIINDAVNGNLGDFDYYSEVCSNLNKSDIDDVFDAMEAENLIDLSTDVGNKNSGEEEVTDENQEEPRSRDGGIGMIPIVIVAVVALIIIGAGAVVFILFRKNGFKKVPPTLSKEQRRRTRPYEKTVGRNKGGKAGDDYDDYDDYEDDEDDFEDADDYVDDDDDFVDDDYDDDDYD